MSERPRVEGHIDGTVWTLFDAGRSTGGLGLGYFVSTEDGPPDRRAALPPDTIVTELDADGFRELWEKGAPLTGTERRFEGPDGEPWLAQACGPVWYEGETSREVIGVRLRCLGADHPVVVHPGASLADTSDAELVAAIAHTDQ